MRTEPRPEGVITAHGAWLCGVGPTSASLRIAAILMLVTVTSVLGQSAWTAKQTIDFVQASARKYPDKQVAEQLKRVTLSERLTDSALEACAQTGAGALTMKALTELAGKSVSLAAPMVDPVAAETAAPKPAGPPPPSKQKQDEVLAKATEYARGYVKNLPNFTCTQLTERYVDQSGRDAFGLVDKVVETLSYLEGHEDYKVLTVNNKPMTNANHRELGGTTSEGEFGTDMHVLFSPETQTEFEWNSWTTWHGRRTHRFAYRVRQPLSHWNIVYEKSQSVISGYKGLVYVDADLGVIMRITRDSEGIPADFPIQNVHQSTEYDFQKIGESDQEFLLPVKSVITSKTGRASVKNATTFHHYRKFGADIKITFETVDESKEPPAKKP